MSTEEAFDSVLDRIEQNKAAKSSSDTAKPSSDTDHDRKKLKVSNDGEVSSPKEIAGEKKNDLIEAVSQLQPVWYEFIDPSTAKSYYHNYTTNETTWDKPDNFVPFNPHTYTSSASAYPTSSSTADLYSYQVPQVAVQPVDYSTVAFFNQQDGRFGGLGANHWEQKGLPSDRGLRQLAKYVDLTDLERNREEAKIKKAQLQNMKGIDWRKYKEEKKEFKKRKRLAWMLED